MFRLWGKIYKNNKIIKSHVYKSDNRTLNISQNTDDGIDEICQVFDLPKPLWFDDNYKHLKQFQQTSFNQDHFMESIDFDYLEVEIIENDEKK